MKIRIPEPCHEDWTAMTPEAKGRHCAACAKTVVDFAAMTDAQVVAYLRRAGGGTCGRVRPTQLDRRLATPPVLPVALTQPVRRGLAAASIAVGVAAVVGEAGAQTAPAPKPAACSTSAPEPGAPTDTLPPPPPMVMGRVAVAPPPPAEEEFVQGEIAPMEFGDLTDTLPEAPVPPAVGVGAHRGTSVEEPRSEEETSAEGTSAVEPHVTMGIVAVERTRLERVGDSVRRAASGLSGWWDGREEGAGGPPVE